MARADFNDDPTGSCNEPGTVPIKTYWHAGRSDHMLVATAAGEQAAIEAGYSLQRTEGFIPTRTPHALGWTNWHATRLDN